MTDTISKDRRHSYSTPQQHAKLLRSILRTVEAEPDASYETATVVEAATGLAAALQARLNTTSET